MYMKRNIAAPAGEAQIKGLESTRKTTQINIMQKTQANRTKIPT